MKFLRQKFEKFCADLGLDATLYVNDGLYKTLDRFVKVCAEYQLKKALKAPENMDAMISSFTDEKFRQAAEIAAREGKAPINKEDFIETFYSSVEIQAAILLDRLNLLVTGLDPNIAKARPPKTSDEPIIQTALFTPHIVSQTNEELFHEHLDKSWAFVESMDFPDEPQSIFELLEGLDKIKQEFDEKVQLLHGILLDIAEFRQQRLTLESKWDELAILILEMKQQLAVIPLHQHEQFKEYCSTIIDLIQNFKDGKITATTLSGQLQGLDLKLKAFGVPRTASHEIASGFNSVITEIKALRVEINMGLQKLQRQRESIARRGKVKDKIPAMQAYELDQELQEDGAFPSLLKRADAFFDKESNYIGEDLARKAQVVIAEIDILTNAKNYLESLCMTMQLLKINSVSELLEMGKANFELKLREQIFLEEQARSSRNARKISDTELLLNGNNVEFVIYLLPILINLAINKVSDLDFPLGETCEALNLPRNDADMFEMQRKVAKLLEWDFFVHHEEYTEYLRSYMRTNEIKPVTPSVVKKEVLHVKMPEPKSKAKQSAASIFSIFPKFSILEYIPKKFSKRKLAKADITSRHEKAMLFQKGSGAIKSSNHFPIDDADRSPSTKPRTPST